MYNNQINIINEEKNAFLQKLNKHISFIRLKKHHLSNIDRIAFVFIIIVMSNIIYYHICAVLYKASLIYFIMLFNISTFYIFRFPIFFLLIKKKSFKKKQKKI